MVCGFSVSPGKLTLGDSNQEGSSVPGSGDNLPPPVRDLEAVSLDPGGYQLIDSGLLTEVVDTILNAKSPSTR